MTKSLKHIISPKQGMKHCLRINDFSKFVFQTGDEKKKACMVEHLRHVAGIRMKIKNESIQKRAL